MASVQTFEPSGIYARALFNFDETAGWENYRLTGTVRYSTSDSFGRLGSLKSTYPNLYQDLYNSYQDTSNGEVTWLPAELSAIQKLFATVANFASIDFEWVGDFDFTTSATRANPGDVGRSEVSDINITAIYRPDVVWSGLSGGGQEYLGYPGSMGDVFVNVAKFGSWQSVAFDEYSELNQTLMHEVLHSVGLSHPFDDSRNVTADFAALVGAGFEKLGFVIEDPDDLNKEYFTIMSYDDQPSLDTTLWVRNNAYTPMILDVLALQAVYGEGRGTHGSSDDTIMAGNAGYRTYFDRGGVDAIDLEIYAGGGYVDLGLPIGGSIYPVGLVLPAEEAGGLLGGTASPQNLRWMVGNIENVLGSEGPDHIVDNDSDNTLIGRGGDDRFVQARAGSDWIDGGPGSDTVVYRGARSSYVLSLDNEHRLQVRSTDPAYSGIDTLESIETIEFADGQRLTVDALVQTLTVPAALGAAITATEDVALAGQLESSASAGTPVSFFKVTDPVQGVLSLDATGRFTYTPAPNFHGLDGFSFRVRIGDNDSAPAMVSITVEPVNDPATGTLHVLGRIGQGLTVRAESSVSDADGMPVSLDTVQYRWVAGSGATVVELGTSPTLTLTESAVGKAVSVQMSFVDQSGNLESIESAPTVAVPAASLGGTVWHWSNASPLPGVELSIQSATNPSSMSRAVTTLSDQSGGWAFNALDFDRFSLSARKAVSASEMQAVSAADVLAALKIAHGRNPNSDPDGSGILLAPPVSPFQLRSANVDHDTQVTADDARHILAAALGVKPATSTALRWAFVDAAADVSTAAHAGAEMARSIELDADLSTDVRLLGVLLGDVDGSWMRG